MQPFTIDLGRSWFLRLLGRHPLVRPSDRIEALAFVVAAMAIAIAVPAAAVMGTAIHDTRSRMYTARLVGTGPLLSARSSETTCRFRPALRGQRLGSEDQARSAIVESAWTGIRGEAAIAKKAHAAKASG